MNPHALYIKCDGSMNYDAKNTGGIGFEIIFPDSVELENIKESHGRYEGANIERLELEALISGMEYVISLYEKERKKLADLARSKVFIEYMPRKQNKVADKLAKAGKQFSISDDSIAIKGLKVGKRKYDGSEINYKSLKEKEEIHIHVFLKTPLNKQWGISSEICEATNFGKKINIYSDDKLASKLQRRHEYIVKIKKVFTHHIQIYRTVKEFKNIKIEDGN